MLTNFKECPAQNYRNSFQKTYFLNDKRNQLRKERLSQKTRLVLSLQLSWSFVYIFPLARKGSYVFHISCNKLSLHFQSIFLFCNMNMQVLQNSQKSITNVDITLFLKTEAPIMYTFNFINSATSTHNSLTQTFTGCRVRKAYGMVSCLTIC